MTTHTNTDTAEVAPLIARAAARACRAADPRSGCPYGTEPADA